MIKDSLNILKIFINLSGYKLKQIKTIINFFEKKKYKKNCNYVWLSIIPHKSCDLRFDLFKYFKLKKFKYGYADHSIHGISKDLYKQRFRLSNWGAHL